MSSDKDTVPELIPRRPSKGKEGETDEENPALRKDLRVIRSHKRHKSWDLSHTTQQEPYPRSRSRSPLRHSLIEEDEISTSASEWLREVIGINPEDWPYSQELLGAAVSLKLEQEKSKNYSIKLDTVHASMDLLKLAVESNIPPHLIPYMVSSGELSRQLSEATMKENIKLPKSPQKNLQTATSVFKVNIPQQTQFQFHHWQKPGEPKGDFKDERKRKSSDDQQQQPFNTPTRAQSSHRRNQSEANVSHLRSLYENQQQQQNQRSRQVQQMRHPPSQQQYPYQQHNPPPWSGASLGSPYLPSREAQQAYYLYPPPPGQPKASTGYAQPLPGFQFPRREIPPIVTQQQHQQQQQQQAYQHQVQPQQANTSTSPVSARKSDVSFLISTPNNPPK